MALKTLRDGSRVVVRPIEPGDKGALLEGFARLSDESRYRRFLSATPRLTESQLRYLTEVDHDRHEALVAFDEATREPVGVARYVRCEEGSPDAEPAVTVVDHWHGRGLGTVLLEELTKRARNAGVERFIATVLPENKPVIALAEHLDPGAKESLEGGVLRIETELPARGIAPRLRAALRDAAAERLRVASVHSLAWPRRRD